MSCLHCSSFDPYTYGGYCDYHKCRTSSSSTCSADDDKGSSYSTNSRCCQTCRTYDGSYCSYQKSYMSPSDVCGKWS